MKFTNTWSVLGCVALIAAALTCGAACEKSKVVMDDGSELTLSAPADQTVTQGESNKIDIDIDRNDFKGPVDIEFKDLPKGVKVAESDMKIMTDKDSRTFTLVADADAGLVTDSVVTVTAKAKGKSVSETFELTVKSRN